MLSLRRKVSAQSGGSGPTSSLLTRIGPVELLIMQPTPFCNISCDYCYLAHRSDSARMPLEIVEATFRNLLQDNLLGPELTVIWHAGEPLVASPEFYRHAFDGAQRLSSECCRIRHAIQTNGILINDEWCALFKQWGVNIGVSLDGPPHIHDRHRRTRDGRPTHERVMRGIERLQQAQIPFHVITVVTRDSVGHATEIMDFFRKEGITQLAFSIEEAEGIHPSSSMKGLEEAYQTFMQEVLEAARLGLPDVHIRELQSALGQIKLEAPQLDFDGRRVPYNPQIVPGAVITVDHRGGFTTWSPEFIDLKHERFEDFVLGNVQSDSVRQCLDSPRARAIKQEIFRGVAACANECEYFSLCGGGAPINKLIETGSFASTATMYCRCTIQTPLNVALGALETSLGVPINSAGTAQAPKGVFR